jgi:hypothetical protein
MDTKRVEIKFVDFLLTLNNTKRMYKNAKTAHYYLEKNRKLNMKPYQLPKTCKTGWEEVLIEGVQCFLKTGTSKTTLFYLSGGAYFCFPNAYHFRMLDDIQKGTNATVLLAIYPLAPNYTFAESYSKIWRVFLHASMQYGAKNLVLMGDSSGGGIALGLTEMLALQHFSLFGYHTIKSGNPCHRTQRQDALCPWTTGNRESMGGRHRSEGLSFESHLWRSFMYRLHYVVDWNA